VSQSDRDPSVEINSSNRKVRICWPNDTSAEFHYVWLRHNARCPGGMSNDTNVKLDLLPDDPASLIIEKARISEDCLHITWGDNQLQTTHSLETLLTSRYDQAFRKQQKPTPILWGADNASSIPHYSFDDLTHPERVFNIALTVRDFGIVRIKDVPAESGTVAAVAQRFGVVHHNNYGSVFDVRSDANLSLGSNTGKYLGPHTDESYRHAAPGITFFHCLTASSDGGGATILVDGFKAADMLRISEPESFKTLTQVPVFFQRRALPEEDMQSHRRIIVLDVDGDVEGIRFTDRTIPPQDLPDHLMEDVYKAIKAFWTIVNTDELKYEYPMRSGDLHVFDNQRVLHGRTEFNPLTGERHLQQCSVNRDEFQNTIRILAVRCNHPAQRQAMSGGALG